VMRAGAPQSVDRRRNPFFEGGQRLLVECVAGAVVQIVVQHQQIRVAPTAPVTGGSCH
jgi:hypothetical protein